MAFCRRGDYFGDMGLLDGNTDSATVIAMEFCKVLLVSKSVFDEFFLENFFENSHNLNFPDHSHRMIINRLN
jgi:CRP-like cAMP-binding protein